VCDSFLLFPSGGMKEERRGRCVGGEEKRKEGKEKRKEGKEKRKEREEKRKVHWKGRRGRSVGGEEEKGKEEGAYQDFLLDQQDGRVGFQIDSFGALDDLETFDRHVLFVRQTQSDCVKHDSKSQLLQRNKMNSLNKYFVNLSSPHPPRIVDCRGVRLSLSPSPSLFSSYSTYSLLQYHIQSHSSIWPIPGKLSCNNLNGIISINTI
jgi:hypothetical protein